MNPYQLPKPKSLKLSKLQRPCLIEEKIDGWRMVIWKGYAYGRNTDSLGYWINKWDKLPENIQALASEIPVDGEVYWPGKDSAAVSTGLKERSSKLRFKGFRIANQDLFPQEHLIEVGKLGISIPKLISLTYQDYRTISKEILIQIAKKNQIEGWVLKEQFIAPYWWKLKIVETYDIVITGLIWSTSGKNFIEGWIKSLECSIYRDGKLEIIANVSGMTDEVRASITKSDIGRVIEVEANLLASKGRLKHPRFIRWRDDKNAKECRI